MGWQGKIGPFVVEYVFYIMTDTPLEKSTNSDYGASQIQVLEGLEAVRKRPGMYVGGTDSKAMHHLIYEVMDNSVDEALAGFCNRIEVTIHADESVTVRDNGRGYDTASLQSQGLGLTSISERVLMLGGTRTVTTAPGAGTMIELKIPLKTVGQVSNLPLIKKK